MEDLVSYSSGVVRIWVHLRIKVKYCHEVFDIPEIKARTEHLLCEAMEAYRIEYEVMGTDREHIHFVLDIGIRSMPEIVKCLKGYAAKKLFQEYPQLKKQYFWKSGFWNPSYYAVSVGKDKEKTVDYVRKQGMPKDQSTLGMFINN